MMSDEYLNIIIVFRVRGGGNYITLLLLLSLILNYIL